MEANMLCLIDIEKIIIMNPSSHMPHPLIIITLQSTQTHFIIIIIITTKEHNYMHVHVLVL